MSTTRADWLGKLALCSLGLDSRLHLSPQSTPWGENLGPDVSRGLYLETNRRLLKALGGPYKSALPPQRCR
jgi:hypothetical protein